MFYALLLEKRKDTIDTERYKNVCLILDNDEQNQVCTDQPQGFSGFTSDTYIGWHTDQPKQVRNVYLHFHQTGRNGYAQIADLKIIYDPIVQGNQWILQY